ncbi:MAG: hypothetical protein DMG08_12460 [Acidobacteria bacterium]|nr:MAG: hypothetical protein DMG08_12460 [Acidobacteriota bacterium]
MWKAAQEDFKHFIHHGDTEYTGGIPPTKLKFFASSSRASRLRGQSPAQDSPRSREERQEREDFAMKNPFPPKFFWFRFFLRSETSDTIPER